MARLRALRALRVLYAVVLPALVTLIFWGWSPAAHAASGPEPTPESLAARADRIVLADVASVRIEGEAEGAPALAMRTVTQLVVRESWKGRGPELLEVVQLGGQRGGQVTGVVGDARFTPGEQVLVFLRCTEAEGARCTLVGLGKGRMRLSRGEDAQGDAVELREAGRVQRVPVGQLRRRLGLAAEGVGTGGQPVRPLTPASPSQQRPSSKVEVPR